MNVSLTTAITVGWIAGMAIAVFSGVVRSYYIRFPRKHY